MKAPRQFLPAARFTADGNIQPGHPADAAAWIWHPEAAQGETAVLRFSLSCVLPSDSTVEVHVTADQRFQLHVDGAEVGFGPDRSDVEQWSVASYRLSLSAGAHQFSALVWWLKDESITGHSRTGGTAPLKPPVAQASWRGGFLLAGEGAWANLLSTGRANWQVEDLTAAVRLVRPVFHAYHDIGPEFHVDGARWNGGAPAKPAVVVAGAITGNPHGVVRPGWRIAPATLPEQLREPMWLGRVRSLRAEWTDAPYPGTEPVGTDAWQRLLHGEGTLEIPPHSGLTMLWDFEAYVCGYARLATAGGAGARVRIDWAEALHEADSPVSVNSRTAKGDRGEIAGKVFYGFGDEFAPAKDPADFPALWWRAGRYLRVQVRTAAESLTIRRLAVVSTGYPLGEAARFASDDVKLNRLLSVCEATTRACAHEVWTDCPYYEQMAYVGDSRLAALINYVVFADDRLSRRMLQLFDDSRRANGLVAERAPASWQQVSVTYSLLWVLMVRDFAWWRDDRAFVRARLRGVRAMIDEVLAFRAEDGLLRAVPGWSFVDWVPGWNEGCGPGVREGDSSIVNLHLLLALRAHAELEFACGEPELAARARRLAEELERAVLERYWSAERGLLADTGARRDFSEHAQALGLVAGIQPPGGAAAWVQAWLAAPGLARATGYFSFYIMEAFRLAGCGAELHLRIDAGREVLATGLLTMPEAPEPTRSDCHGWSAHLRWHFAASVAGVRPLAPGFARVAVAPQLGPLQRIEVTVPHPRGEISVGLRRESGRLRGRIGLPAALAGEFHWEGAVHPLLAGENLIDEPSP
jgi:alpha-L-rhamnosidase